MTHEKIELIKAEPSPPVSSNGSLLRFDVLNQAFFPRLSVTADQITHQHPDLRKCWTTKVQLSRSRTVLAYVLPKTSPIISVFLAFLLSVEVPWTSFILRLIPQFHPSRAFPFWTVCPASLHPSSTFFRLSSCQHPTQKQHPPPNHNHTTHQASFHSQRKLAVALWVDPAEDCLPAWLAQTVYAVIIKSR